MLKFWEVFYECTHQISTEKLKPLKLSFTPGWSKHFSKNLRKKIYRNNSTRFTFYLVSFGYQIVRLNFIFEPKLEKFLWVCLDKGFFEINILALFVIWCMWNKNDNLKTKKTYLWCNQKKISVWCTDVHPQIDVYFDRINMYIVSGDCYCKQLWMRCTTFLFEM